MKLNHILFGLLIFNISFVQLGFAQQENNQDKVIQVSVESLNDVLILKEYSISADSVSLNHSQLSAQASGEILRINAQVGDNVSLGDVLIELDCRYSELSESAAMTALDLASKEHKRAKSLQQSKAIAEQQLNQARATLDQARISLEQGQIAIEHCKITAPFDGVITQRQAQLGSIVSPGLPMMKLLQVGKVEVEVELDEAQLNALKSAAKPVFFSRGNQYPLSMRTVLPLIDKNNNKQKVRLTFTQQAAYAGASGKIHWQGDEKLMPVDYIVERDNGLGFFMVEGETARFVVLPEAILGHPATIPADLDKLNQIQIINQGRYSVENASLINIQ